MLDLSSTILVLSKTMEVVFARADAQIVTLVETVKAMKPVIASLEEILSAGKKNQYQSMNPWEEMSNTTDGTASGLRSKFLSFYQLNIKGASSLHCMFTQKATPDEKLKLAHILPRSTKANTFRSLGLESSDINCFRNFLLLSENVEEAFDALRISFVQNPANPLHHDYILHVWDDRVLEEFVFKGSTEKIKNFAGNSLSLLFPNGQMHNPFRRCLSFQAWMSFWKWSREGKHGLSEPEDFDDSLYDNHDVFKADREKYLSQLRSDISHEL